MHFLKGGEPLKFLGVGEVLMSSDLKLIGNQIFTRDEPDADTVEVRLDTIPPGLIEGHLPDGGQDVNRSVGQVERELVVVIEEIGGVNIVDRRAERTECFVGCGCILNGRPDKNVEVARIALNAMRVHGYTAHNDVFNAVSVKRIEE
jgi:hypothetical protein